MPAAVIDFFGRIVQYEPARIVDKQEWLTRVISPAVRHLMSFQDRTIDRLDLILELVNTPDVRAAKRNWEFLIAAHNRLSVPLREFSKYVVACKHRDIVELVEKLQRFFQLESIESDVADIEQALRPGLVRAIGELLESDSAAAAATISAEILHIQLKWAILHNDCLSLESAVGNRN